MTAVSRAVVCAPSGPVQTSSGAGRASRSRSASTASRIEAGVARVAAEGRGEGVELFAEAERDQLGL